MAFVRGANVVTNGLVMVLDAANPRSYVSGSTTWRDLSGNNSTASLVNNTGYIDPPIGGLVFNGSSSYCNYTASYTYLSSSAIEVVFNCNDAPFTSQPLKLISGYRHNPGYSFPTIGAIYLEGRVLKASVITTTQTYRTVADTSLINLNSYYYVVLNKNVETGVLDLYVNGSLKGTTTFDSASYAQWPGLGNYIGANQFDIGKSSNTADSQGWGSGSYFSGSIHSIKLYNRVLSSTEVLQNYNATKARFGL
jgi:hypothetical protein